MPTPVAVESFVRLRTPDLLDTLVRSVNVACALTVPEPTAPAHRKAIVNLVTGPPDPIVLKFFKDTGSMGTNTDDVDTLHVGTLGLTVIGVCHLKSAKLVPFIVAEPNCPAMVPAEISPFLASTTNIELEEPVATPDGQGILPGLVHVIGHQAFEHESKWSHIKR